MKEGRSFNSSVAIKKYIYTVGGVATSYLNTIEWIDAEKCTQEHEEVSWHTIRLSIDKFHARTNSLVARFSENEIIICGGFNMVEK